MRVNARPELGLGEVLRVQESAGQYLADVVFQVGEHRILDTYPAAALESVPIIFERYLRAESDSITDFCLKQLAFQIPIENAGGELSNSRTDLLPHQILLTHQVVNAPRRRFLIADEVGLGKTIETGMILRGQGDALYVFTFGCEPAELGRVSGENLAISIRRRRGWERKP